MYAYSIFVAAFFGLLIGSFLNACAYRIPRGISIARGRSFCPRCETQIKARDNVPLLGWLMLRGRCRACAQPISPRYPIVEALTSALFAVTVAVQGVHWVVLPYLFFVAVMVLVSDIDIEFRIIPNVVIVPAALIGLAAMVGLSLAGLQAGPWYEWPLAGGAAALFLLVIAEIYRKLRGVQGMGMGDVKMAFCMGTFLGVAVIPALFLGFLGGALAGLGLIWRKGETAKTALPFGPFLGAGAVIALFVGMPLIHGYLDLISR